MKNTIIALLLTIVCASCRKSEPDKPLSKPEIKTEVQVEFGGTFQKYEFINIKAPTNFYWSSEESYGVISYKIELVNQSAEEDKWTYEISEADIGSSKGSFNLNKANPKYTWSGKIAGLRVKTNKDFQSAH